MKPILLPLLALFIATAPAQTVEAPPAGGQASLTHESDYTFLLSFRVRPDPKQEQSVNIDSSATLHVDLTDGDITGNVMIPIRNFNVMSANADIFLGMPADNPRRLVVKINEHERTDGTGKQGVTRPQPLLYSQLVYRGPGTYRLGAIDDFEFTLTVREKAAR
ncbi:hypothetical protein OJ996_25690 [Luteolibacter sp. GHJ8]|uniref:CS1 type fimbrial major subunit n=1 Tax=Luteolibacter rhizosphaerae TaxID=2989719 RepID=A0ABT3GAY6_9BACT|nr:hypothetical protein [Luteolibacter rhizosphaerae]MCW1917008.1 hypothetical protein [Luteolibacter rhizosphaerae]